MLLIYAAGVDAILSQQLIETIGDECPKLPYARLGDDLDTGDVKKIWLFPDITKSFKDVRLSESKTIQPYKYYVTSGEAVKKTEVLISDIKEAIDNTLSYDAMDQITTLLIDLDEFLNLLIATKGPAKYLELTKCEDGIYNGNICARKNPKKKKEELTEEPSGD